MNDAGGSAIQVLLIGADTLFEQYRSFLREMKVSARVCIDATMARDFAVGAAPEVIIVGSAVSPFDGEKMIELLRAERRLEQTPILLLTSRSAPAGAADECLRPSTTPLDLYEAVNRWMNRTSAARPGASPMEKRPVPRPPAEPAAAASDAGETQQGELKEWTVGSLLYQLSRADEEHILLVKMNQTKVKIKVGRGKVANIASNFVPAATLGALLVAEGILAPPESEAIWAKARKSNRRFGEMLTDLNLLSSADLKGAVRRQKIAKMRYFVCHPKPQGTYNVRLADSSADSGASLEVDVASFLIQTILKDMPLRMAIDFLARHEAAGNPLLFADRANEFWGQLELPASFPEYAKRLNGKTLGEMKIAIPPAEHPAWLRYAHLMVVLGCAWFVEKQAFAVPPKAPAAEARPAPAPARPAPATPTAPLATFAPPDPPRHGVRPANPEAAAELVRIAREHLLDKRYGEAVSTLHQATRFAPRSGEISALWAWADFCSLSQYDASIVGPIKRRLEKAITVDENNEWAHLYMGKILKAEKDERGAMAHFLAAQNINPHNEEVEREITLQQIKQRTRKDLRI